MKKDKITAKFIRDKLIDLICVEYNRENDNYDNFQILVNSIYDIYKLYTPDDMQSLEEWLTNVIDPNFKMINYPPKDDEFIQIKTSHRSRFFMDLNDKFNNNDFIITYSKNHIFPPIINITFKITDIHSITFSDNKVFITEAENLLSNTYDCYTNVPKGLQDKINLFIDNIHKNFDEKYYKTGLRLMSNVEAVNYIYDNIEKFNNKPIETEKWIYDKNLIECDDKYYIFRLESNFLSDNEKDTLLTTWRNICHKGHKFIAFCEKPNNPKFDYVKG